LVRGSLQKPAGDEKREMHPRADFFTHPLKRGAAGRFEPAATPWVIGGLSEPDHSEMLNTGRPAWVTSGALSPADALPPSIIDALRSSPARSGWPGPKTGVAPPSSEVSA